MFALDICLHSSLYGFSADSYSAEMTVSTKQASLPPRSAHARAKLDLPFDMQKVQHDVVEKILFETRGIVASGPCFTKDSPCTQV
ncbi:unnamed protein product [Larinioides sclopetarius]|uniref:Uncharacterized protein n=1 Tax=Larinioides sclopetarius TaxID=280406 RepID=A0AAV1ZUV3_9ARAC